MIEINHVTMSYDADPVVKDVNLTIAESGITALIGANGAGKSTLLSGIGRLMGLTDGEVSIDGKPIEQWDSTELAQTIAILRQENQMTVRLTVSELAMLGRYPHNHGRARKIDHEIVADALANVDMLDCADRFIDQLSGGQRQRAFVAMTLAQQTKYLLLDEPLAAMDMKHSRDMMRYLRKICDTQKISVVIVIHDINTAAAYADRLIAMREGEIITDGTPDQVMTPGELKKVFDVDVEVTELAGRPIAMPIP